VILGCEMRCLTVRSGSKLEGHHIEILGGGGGGEWLKEGLEILDGA